ncbi:GIY-YIG nuclease family protein [Labrenzia sp. OB1]|uniref:GIY-YIG nuclease family protein n=1 Tax=Labrenzia sp. OB1 TaxID=1561204 RepID=UPI0009EDE7BF|nr:GIY-YIG nuclease family protein [Labrenzia sp. OB1]
MLQSQPALPTFAAGATLEATSLRKEENLPVYFLANGEERLSPIKIGRTNSLKRRMSELQTGNPVQLRLLGYIETTEDASLEAQLHREFYQKRLSGEWFDIEAEEIVPVLLSAGAAAYAPPEDAIFEFESYDRSGIPCFVRGAAWLDLQVEELCPSCGCFGGIHYQGGPAGEICLRCGYMPTHHDA